MEAKILSKNLMPAHSLRRAKNLQIPKTQTKQQKEIKVHALELEKEKRDANIKHQLTKMIHN
jgi:hypothetical protein